MSGAVRERVGPRDLATRVRTEAGQRIGACQRTTRELELATRRQRECPAVLGAHQQESDAGMRAQRREQRRVELVDALPAHPRRIPGQVHEAAVAGRQHHRFLGGRLVAGGLRPLLGQRRSRAALRSEEHITAGLAVPVGRLGDCLGRHPRPGRYLLERTAGIPPRLLARRVRRAARTW